MGHSYGYQADAWQRLVGSDFRRTFSEDMDWVSVKDYGNVSLNFNNFNTGGTNAQIEDVSDVWIDTDSGNSWFKVIDAYDVTIQLDQYGNGFNSINLYDVWDVNVNATGGHNYMRIDDADDVSARFDWGSNTVDIDDADDIWLSLGGNGDNTIYINDVDHVGAEIWGGDNQVFINMEQAFADWGEESVWLNFQGSRGHDHVEVRDADDVYIDTDGGGGYFYVSVADNVRVQLDQHNNGDNTIKVYQADDVDIDATGGSNTVRVKDAWDVDVNIGQGANTLDIDDVDDLNLTIKGDGDNTIAINDADSVRATIHGDSNTIKIDMEQSAFDFGEESVSINMNGGGNDSIEIRDADSVFVDTDAGGGYVYVNQADDVHLQFDQYGNGDNFAKVYHADDVLVHATGGGNMLYAGYNDDVSVDYDWGDNHVDIWHADAVNADFGGGGSNFFKVHDADSVNATIHDGNNEVLINMNQDSFADLITEQAVHLNFNGSEGGNKVTVTDADYTWIDIDAGNNSLVLNDVDDFTSYIDGGHNTVRVTDADDVKIDIDNQSGSGNNSIVVTNADDVLITTSEGANDIRLSDIDNIDILTVGWHNKIDIDGAGDLVNVGTVNIHNTWGGSRYQDIDIDDVDDVNITMNALNDSNIWINDADDVVIESYGSSTGSNNVINIGQETSVEDVTVNLAGNNNVVNIRSIIDLISQSDIQIDMGSNGSTNIYSAGGTADIDIRGSSRDTVVVAGAYASVYTYGGDDHIEVYALGADIDAGDGDDTIEAFTVGANIYGGAGADEILAITVGAHINAGSGDDVVHAVAAGSHIDTGSGDDTLWLGGLASYINAGSGDDNIYSLAVGGQAILAGDGDNVVAAIGGVNSIISEAGNDSILALGGLNVVSSGAGNDTVFTAGGLNMVHSGAGDDAIMAFGGANLVHAGSGDDHVYAAGFANLVIGDEGNDTVVALGAKNILLGGTINDPESMYKEVDKVIDGKSSFDLETMLFDQGSGDDVLIGVGASNRFYGADGDDTLIAAGIKNSLNAGHGDDVVLAIGGMNTMAGNLGDDTMVGLGGLNLAFGGLEHDTIIVTGGGNFVGADMTSVVGSVIGLGVAIGDFASDMMHNLNSLAIVDPVGQTQASYEDIDLISNLHDIVNTPDGGNDNIIALGAGNLILGGGGNDNIYASGAANIIYAGDGEDTVIVQGVGSGAVMGGSGDDTLIDLSAVSFLMGGEGDDTIIGFGRGILSDFSTSLDDAALEFSEIVADFFDSISSAVGGAVVGTNAFIDALGGDATDTLSSATLAIDGFFTDLSGELNSAIWDFKDSANGENSGWSDFLSYGGRFGEPDDTTLNDWINASQDVATQFGGAGDDIIVSGFGVQTVDGGEGNDTYVVYEAEGIDFIQDSGGANDVIDYRMDTSDATLSMDLGDIFFMADESDLWISTGVFNTIVVDGMGDENSGVEGFSINLGDDVFTLDLQKIYDDLDEGQEVSLADILNVDQETTFGELESLLKDEIDENTEVIDAVAIDTADLSSVLTVTIDDQAVNIT